MGNDDLRTENGVKKKKARCEKDTLITVTAVTMAAVTVHIY